MSTRTLQRRLGEAGTSYQALLDEVRREAARRLLADTDLNTGEVAFLLGFEELNSFTRAFHSWEGTTPARWRASADHRVGQHLRDGLSMDSTRRIPRTELPTLLPSCR